MKRLLALTVILGLLLSLLTACDLAEQLENLQTQLENVGQLGADWMQGDVQSQPDVTDPPDTTAPPETTLPPETTRPPETTLPPETTAPPETTLPPETVEVPEKAVPYLLDIPRADQSIFAKPTYDSQFVRTVEKAGWYTIVEEQWDSEGNLWGKLKSGIGWIDLSELYYKKEYPDLVTANYADKELLKKGNYHHCVVDDTEYAEQVAFRAAETLYNVQFFVTVYDAETGWETSENLLFLAKLTPQKPLVVDVAFGDTTEYKISFEDGDGEFYVYTISVSGRNGALICSP